MNSKDEEPLKGQEPEEPTTGNTDNAVTLKKTTVKDNDTAPDEFIGHDADTDLPVDRQITNDGVLRGEKPFGEEEANIAGDQQEGPKKMDAGKK
jgi:hypothetical protein